MDDLEDILQKFVPKRLYDELRRDHDRLLIRLGRMEEQLLMLSDYRLEPEERTEVIDRKVRRAERSGRRRAKEMIDDEEERPPRRSWGRSRRKSREADLDSDDLDDTLVEESTEDLIRRLRERYQEISRLRDRLREEEE